MSRPVKEGIIADLCGISVDKLWSEEIEDFVGNPNYDGPGLFIHSELASRKEINPMFLACVSGVDVKHNTMGNLDSSEKIRVLEAGRILERNNLILCDMPDFTSANIKRKIEDCVRQYGTTTIGFDYLQLQSAISAEYKATTSIPAREDLVLRALATDLKSYAEQYNVAIMTASQLNGNEKQTDFPDESCLSSSKAIKQVDNANFSNQGFHTIHKGDLNKAMEGTEGFRVLLSHDPSHWSAEVIPNTDIPLTLSGHTHSAQIRIFGWTPAKWSFKEVAGRYDRDGQTLYINVGLGCTAPIRLGVNPEVTVITLRISTEVSR